MLFVIGLVGLLAVVLSAMGNYRTFLIVLLAVKPFVDLTWDITLFSLAGFPINPLRIIGLVVFFRAALEYASRRGPIAIYNEKVILVFLGLMAFTSFANLATGYSSFDTSLNVFLRIADSYLIYFTCARILNKEADYRLIVGLVWGTTLMVSLFSIGLYKVGTYEVDISQGVTRFSGLYNDPGSPAYNAVLSMAYAALFMEGYRLRKARAPALATLALVGTFVVAVAMLSITITKGAGVMFIIFIGLWYGIYRKRTYLIAPLVVAALVYIYNTNEDIQARLAPDLAVFSADHVTEDVASRIGGGRVFTFLQLLNLYATEFNGFQMAFGSARWFGAHNQYLAFLLQLGLVGLVVFMVMLWRFYWRLWTLYSQYKHPATFMAIVMLTMFAVASLAGTPFYYTTFLWYLMLLVGMINVTSYRTPRRKAEESSPAGDETPDASEGHTARGSLTPRPAPRRGPGSPARFLAAAPRAAWALAFIGIAWSPAQARDWFTRPYTPAGYGSSDGMSYATAFNGMHGGAIQWKQIAPGDVLRICGFHDGGGLDYATHNSANPVLYVIGRHGLPNRPITITGDCPGDPGIIFGASMKYDSGWVQHDAASNVYSRNCAPYPKNLVTFNHVHARPHGAEGANDIVLLKAGDPRKFSSWRPGTIGRDASGNCFFKPPAGTANDYTVFVAYEYPNINLQDSTHFRIENITLLNGNNASWGSSVGIREGTRHIALDGVRIKWADDVAIGVGPHSTDIQITNCEISDSGLGIYLSGSVSRATIARNEIHHLNQRGEFGKRGSDLHAIALQGGGDGILIESNHIHHIGSDGIVIYFDPRLARGLTNTVIRDNHIHDAIDLSDLHRPQRGIEFGGDKIPPDAIYGNEIYGNHIHDIGNPVDDRERSGIGIRLKAPWNPGKGSSWEVRDNVIENANIGLAWIHDNDINKGPGFTFKNNTVVNSRSQHVYLYALQRGRFGYNGADIDYNRYFPDGWGKFGFFTRFNVPEVLHDPQTGNLRQWRDATGKDKHSVILPAAPASAL